MLNSTGNSDMGVSLLRMADLKMDTAPCPTHANDDRALVTAARRDPRAFGALYERYVSQIYRYAYVRLRNAPAAEDATSQAFLQALRALSQFRDGLFIAWLYRIAHNVVADAVRRAPVTTDYDAMEFDLQADDSTEDAAVRETERAAFYRALRDLPQEQRNVLEMTASGFTGEEIAQILGKTPASVKMLRWRGMDALRTRMAREGMLSEVER
jgi:RNA polymerase sigma-70 factor (ECF subfamily)